MANGVYVCAICGTAYNSIEERAACETKCIAAKKENEEKLRQEKLEAEKEARREEIEATAKHYNELVKAYVKDYGKYSVTRAYNELFPISKFFL